MRYPVTKRRATEQIAYCHVVLIITYIDRGNGVDEPKKYDMCQMNLICSMVGGPPKLSTHYFKMNLNNTYKIYCVLYHPTDVVILQQGNGLRQRGYDAPPSATKGYYYLFFY